MTRTSTDPPTTELEVDAGDGTYHFTGQHLAHVSSRWSTHGGEHIGEVVTRGARCSACRWTEIAIYRADDLALAETAVVNVGSALGRYLVITRGCTSVPGESTYVTPTWTNSPYEVLEILTQRKDGRVFLPGPAARALSRAAEFDEGLNDAYVNRAVS